MHAMAKTTGLVYDSALAMVITHRAAWLLRPCSSGHNICVPWYSLFLFLDPPFHNPCTSFVCPSLLPKEQLASNYFFPIGIVLFFFFNICVQFGISDTVS